MSTNFIYKLTSDKKMEDVVSHLEKQCGDNMFRVLHTHNVQATLEEKGFDIKPLKIMEICNAGFAYKALGINKSVASFMPCKFVVEEENGKTSVSLFLPSMIAEFIKNDELKTLAIDVENKLKKIMEQSV